MTNEYIKNNTPAKIAHENSANDIMAELNCLPFTLDEAADLFGGNDPTDLSNELPNLEQAEECLTQWYDEVMDDDGNPTPRPCTAEELALTWHLYAAWYLAENIPDDDPEGSAPSTAPAEPAPVESPAPAEQPTEAVPAELLVIDYKIGGDAILQVARRLAPSEAANYAAWYRALCMIGLGEAIKLPTLDWRDMPNRPRDGELRDNSQAWVITQAEWNAYIALDAERQEAQRIREEAKTRAKMLDIIARADRQGGAYTTEEAKRRTTAWINVVNEGGEGYVPHYVTVDAVERAKAWLANHPN